MRNTITELIILTMAVAAIAVIGSSCWKTEAQHTRLIFATDQGIYGFVPGQTARFSVAYPSTTQEGSQPVRVQAYIYDSTGRLLSQTAEVEVRADPFSTFDFNRDDLLVTGEPDTGRLQVRAVIQVALMDGSVRNLKLPVWMEVMDNRTGGTVGGPYFCGSITVSDD